MICLGSLVACSGYDEDIAAVQRAKTGSIANKELMERLAGKRGKVTWSGRKLVESSNKSDTILIEAIAKRAINERKPHEIVLQYTYNRLTKRTALYEVLMDGEPKGVLGGAAQLLLLQLE